DCGWRGETAWRAIVARAGPPVGGIVGIAERVDDFEGRAVAIRRGWPAVFVVVIHRGDGLTVRRQQCHPLAAVVQRFVEVTEHGNTRIPCGKRSGTQRGSEHDDLTRSKQRRRWEDIAYTVERKAAHVHGRNAVVPQFDEL